MEKTLELFLWRYTNELNQFPKFWNYILSLLEVSLRLWDKKLLKTPEKAITRLIPCTESYSQAATWVGSAIRGN